MELFLPEFREFKNVFSCQLHTKAYDAAGRRFTYSFDGNNRLTQVKAEVKTQSDWTNALTVAQVDYTYYDGSTSHGSAGDLELVKITIPQTDSEDHR